MRHPSLIALSHDHHHGLALALRCRKQALGQLKPMGAAGLRERAEEFLAFYTDHLLVHFKAEEEVLFPILRDAVADVAPMVDELIGDHEQIRSVVTELEAGTGLAKLLFDLGDLLERHIRKEERELFPIFEQQLDETKANMAGIELKRILDAGTAGTARVKVER